MSFALLGYGRFGQAFANLLRRAGHRLQVFDPAAEVPAPLAAASAAAAIAEASWVVLAMPVPRLESALRELRPLLHRGHIVIDVGSVKQHPCELMDELLGTAIPHLGTHPLFGPLSLARGERPLRTVICPSGQHPEAAMRARRLFEELGCEVITQDPATHDRAMAETHALAFFIAKAMVDLGIGEDLTVAPPSFLGLASMLSAVRGDAGHLFAAIQRENPYAADARARLLTQLEAIHRQLLAGGDGGALSIPDLSEDSDEPSRPA
ncbi:prephenate dehydrogenase [Dyella halodurans]|uniref:Prephenate dehydrogenase/arogenate dehydrogenase family protein n=1 Tax=Dyella halodurans TaxID=1920171 RepID=A0ABV9BX96_9GAMM|nr:prephenate dehydrogenase [Dyella halodurans]